MTINDLDILLKYLYDRRNGDFLTVAEIHSDLKNRFTESQIISLLDYLEHRYVTSIKRHPTEGCLDNEVYKLSFEGVLYFEKSWSIWKNRPMHFHKRMENIVQIYTIIKTIMAAAVTVTIVFISYLQWRSMDKENVNYVQQERDIQNLYDSFVNVQMDRDSLEKRILKLESE